MQEGGASAAEMVAALLRAKADANLLDAKMKAALIDAAEGAAPSIAVAILAFTEARMTADVQKVVSDVFDSQAPTKHRDLPLENTVLLQLKEIQSFFQQLKKIQSLFQKTAGSVPHPV